MLVSIGVHCLLSEQHRQIGLLLSRGEELVGLLLRSGVAHVRLLLSMLVERVGLIMSRGDELSRVELSRVGLSRIALKLSSRDIVRRDDMLMMNQAWLDLRLMSQTRLGHLLLRGEVCVHNIGMLVLRINRLGGLMLRVKV